MHTEENTGCVKPSICGPINTSPFFFRCPVYFFDNSSNKSIPSIETFYCQITPVDARAHWGFQLHIVQLFSMIYVLQCFGALPCHGTMLQEAIRKEGDEEQEEAATINSASSPVKRVIGSPFAR